VREGDGFVPQCRGSPRVEVTGSRVSERGPCRERQLGPRTVQSRRCPSLLPAPAANGDGCGRAAARDAGCHAGVIHGVGPHGAGAQGMGVTARQRPAVVTGHRHLTGEKRSPSAGQQRGRGLPVPGAAQGDVASATVSCWTPGWCLSRCRWVTGVPGKAGAGAALATRCRSQADPRSGQQREEWR